MNTLNPVTVNSTLDQAFQNFAMDEDGFLLDPSIWNREVGEIIATQHDIGPLGEAHWNVIDFLRDRYLCLGAIPPMRHICRSSTLSRRELKQAFGSCLQVWRIAGLPNPGEEAKAYLGSL